MGAEDQEEGALEEAARGLLDKEGLWARDHPPLCWTEELQEEPQGM